MVRKVKKVDIDIMLDGMVAVEVKPTVLQEAVNIVNGARRNAYGHPENNFANIADMWNVYLRNRKTSSGKEQAFVIEAIDVAHMMGLMKYARLSENPLHRDSMVDVAGYAACAGMVAFNE